MTSTQFNASAAALVLSTLIIGCSAAPIEEPSGLSVYGLTETRTFAACSEQILDVASSSGMSSSVFTWNVTAPSDASYSATPNEAELHFAARTPGEYLIAVTECSSDSTSSSDCAVTEFAVTVVVGQDTNVNGIGDACETTDCVPACDGRTCGLDPVCLTSCGTCGTGQTCDVASGQCQAECVPACEGRSCGLDPVCGKSCGSCGAGQSCDETVGQCEAACVPACEGRTCGLDPVCHTSCGTCSDGSTCNAQGTCETTADAGRVVTIVMALSDRRLGFTDPHLRQRSKLIEQSVRWVSPVKNPKVLLVLDDVTSDWSHEAQMIRAALARRAIAVTLTNEPSNGLRADQVVGYDVVWFTNPALPIDDALTATTLTSFVRHGGGLILQGDDITQSKALEPLTRLSNVSTGKDYCGLHIDDDRGPSYSVTIERSNHPVIAGLRGNTYYYGDDIDSANFLPTTGAEVLSWAQAGTCRHGSKRQAKCPKEPVVVAYDLSK